MADWLETRFNNLKGKFKHYCYSEWDGLPIDENCREFECCTCYTTEQKEEIEEQRKVSHIAETLKSVLCDPNGNVSICGSEEDKRIVQECLDKLEKM